MPLFKDCLRLNPFRHGYFFKARKLYLKGTPCSLSAHMAFVLCSSQLKQRWAYRQFNQKAGALKVYLSSFILCVYFVYTYYIHSNMRIASCKKDKQTLFCVVVLSCAKLHSKCCRCLLIFYLTHFLNLHGKSKAV